MQTGPETQSYSAVKGDAATVGALIEAIFAPTLALRLGHHELYLMQVRAARLHRRKAARSGRIRRKRALGA